MHIQNDANIILFGFKSVGKTYFGKLLAEDLKKTFIDTDQLIENQYKKQFKENITCRQIYIRIGEESFRLLEKKAVESIKDVKSSVIAVGGGTMMSSENSLLLKNLGKLIYLDLAKEAIKKKIFKYKKRAPSFLSEESFESLFFERKTVFDALSAYKVELDNKTPTQILEELKDCIKNT